MTTAVEDLMSSPPVTCSADASLAEATTLMDRRQIGAVVITDRHAVVGILTERDLLRASATRIDPHIEPVRRWMTADPDVVGVHDRVDTAWSGLTHHHYRHLPVVDHGDLVGVVSVRDLLTVAQIRPAGEAGVDVPRGLEGVVVAETSVGDVRGQQGFYHYRQYSAVDLAATRSFEDVWHLMVDGALPDRGAARNSPPRWPPSGTSPRAWPPSCRTWPRTAHPSTCSGPPSPSRKRAGLAPGSGHRRRGTPGPGAPTGCGGADRPRRGPPAPARPRSRPTPIGPVARGQLPVDAVGPRRPRRPTSGPSSST